MHLSNLRLFGICLQIFRTLGTPDEKTWPGLSKLPGSKANFVKQR